MCIRDSLNASGQEMNHAIVSDSGHDYSVRTRESFEDWMSFYFLSASMPLGSEDSDGDGYSNLTEYYAQTHPNFAESSPQPQLSLDELNQWQLQFPLLSEFAQYEVFRSETGLREDDFQSILSVQPKVTGESNNIIPLPASSATRAFFRVKISPHEL